MCLTTAKGENEQMRDVRKVKMKVYRFQGTTGAVSPIVDGIFRFGPPKPYLTVSKRRSVLLRRSHVVRSKVYA